MEPSTSSTLTLFGGSLPDGREASEYCHKLVPSGGSPPHTWEILTGELPPGISLDSATGTIAGNPSIPGTFAATLRETDSGNTSREHPVRLSITPRPADPIPPNTGENRIIRVAIDGGLDVATHLIGLPPFSIVRAAVEETRRTVTKIPRNCSSRDDLYRIGAKMLRKPKQHVTAVSTIRDEDFPSRASPSVANPLIREYFIALHRISYGNRLRKSKVRLRRYADVTDPDKCQEAMSLLYYGADVEVRLSKVPVEFLMADNKSILIGFPSNTKTLYGGFHSYDPQQCMAMSRWIDDYGSPAGAPPLRSPTALAEIVHRLTASSPHAPDCLCHAVAFLEDSSPSELIAHQFDLIASWYPPPV